MILMFIGPSSSGKDTFFKPILEEFSLKPIILSTTRPMREGETDGLTYHFISMDEMNRLEKEKKLVERRDYHTVNGLWSYATCAENINLGENYLVVNTWAAYQKYVEFYGPEMLTPIYFSMDDGLRLERALLREKMQDNPNYAEVCRRFLKDSEDFTEDSIKKYNPYVIDNNGTYEETRAQLFDVISLVLQKEKTITRTLQKKNPKC